MDIQIEGRGGALLGNHRSHGTTTRLIMRGLARARSRLIRRVLARLDAGLVHGSLRLRLPGDDQFMLGGRGAGVAAEVHVADWHALLALGVAGTIGAYEAWEAGEWSSPDLVAVFTLFSANAASLGSLGRARGPWRLVQRARHWLRRNSRAGSRRNIHAHYDLGNDFYPLWLDPAMVYSSARFDRGATDLATAQQHKLDAMAERVVGAGRVLEIGCGWGALSARLADDGMDVTAISLSDEQLAWARMHYGPGRAIDFRRQDYRDVSGAFDAIVSVEMVEAVGQAYWPTFVACLARNLRPGGRAALQYISIRDDLFDGYAANADFIQAYVFPGGMLVRESEFRQLAARHGLDWRDQYSFGIDYADTLAAWRVAFDAAVAAGKLPAGFDDRFVRLWRFYLDYCEGGFRGGAIDVAQVTLVRQ